MNIQFFAPIGFTGYGYAALNIIKEMYNNQNNISLKPIGSPSIDTENDKNLIEALINNQLSVPHNSPCIKIWHQFDLLARLGGGRYFGFPFFEIDIMSKTDKYNLDSCDDIIVSSKWAKEVLIDNRVSRPIHVVPLGVDTSIFSPIEKQQKIPNYVFLTIGKWEKRKSHDIIIECFNDAFALSDDVELWLVTHNVFLTKQEEEYWLSLVSNSKLANKIKVFPRLPKHSDVANVIAHSDCGIYISKAEGWNMELLETMAMNKPIIASRYSAHTEYCTNDNCYLVDISQKESAMDGKWFDGTGNWAHIGKTEKEQTIEYMRKVYKQNIKNNPKGLEDAKNLSWNNTANIIQKLL
jgi:glycosyltransferase involved in cell wall biosynthesis